MVGFKLENCDDRRSIGAHVVKTGDGIVTWKSKTQSCVALSSTEVEYIALCHPSKEAVWIVDWSLDTSHRTSF
jgi:hypothetical protein